MKFFNSFLFSSSLLLTVFFFPKVKAQNDSGRLSPYMHTTPRSLSLERLTPSSFPTEAEIFCSFEQCLFGLTRGLVVGGDAFGMIYAPFRRVMDPNWYTGNLYIIDVFGGFQILSDVNSKSFMNAQIGFRQINFDDGSNSVSSQGFTTKVNYSQIISIIYTQGVSFSGYFSGNSTLNNPQNLNEFSLGHTQLEQAVGYFYRITQKYPTYWLSFPADIEVVNWSREQTNLVAPIRLYGHIEPFYAQNNLNFNYNNVSLREQEQNVGIRIAATASFESKEGGMSARYALLGSLGLDFSTSSFSVAQSGNARAALPGRQSISPYLNIGGSWQF